MRRAVLFSFVVAGPAFAHGDEPVIPDAVAALQKAPIFVDYDAEPTLTELEADALGRRLAAKPGVYVAVLPASASEELATNPDGVAAEIGRNVGGDGVYVVSVGGRIGTWPGGAASVPGGLCG